VCLTLFGCVEEEPVEKGNSIRVVTWNLQWFPGKKPGANPTEQVEHIKQVREVIADLDPDILLIQEIRDEAALIQATALVPGLKPVVVSNFPGIQELGIASKLQPLAAWSERWRLDGEYDPPRGFAFAALKVSDSGLLLVYNVHLKSNNGDPARNRAKREESVRQLLHHLEKMENSFPQHEIAGAIIGGDFNTSLDPVEEFQGEKTLSMIMQAGFESLNLVAIQSKTKGGELVESSTRSRIDHVLAKGCQLVDSCVEAVEEAVSYTHLTLPTNREV